MLDPWRFELGAYFRPPLGYPHTEEALLRSWKMLNDYLTHDQRNDLVTTGHFYTGQRRHLHKVHIIAITATVNVCAGKTTWCSHPRKGYKVPLWDKLLAQQLAITNDPDYFFEDAATPWRTIRRPLDTLPKRFI